MIKKISHIKYSVFSLLLITCLLFSSALTASAAFTWKGTSLKAGAYHHFVDTDSDDFYRDTAVSVSHSIKYSQNVPSTVSAGYYANSKYTKKFSANGTKNMSSSYKVPKKTYFKFYIYNGSSNKITVSKMTATF